MPCLVDNLCMRRFQMRRHLPTRTCRRHIVHHKMCQYRFCTFPEGKHYTMTRCLPGIQQHRGTVQSSNFL